MISLDFIFYRPFRALSFLYSCPRAALRLPGATRLAPGGLPEATRSAGGVSLRIPYSEFRILKSPEDFCFLSSALCQIAARFKEEISDQLVSKL
jgi:hypothetical protein